MKATLRIGILALALVWHITAVGQTAWESISVQDVKARCGAIEGAKVQMIGYISKVGFALPSMADTYTLCGYRGGEITVQFTSRRPVPSTHVFVRGVVSIDANGNCYIVESLREKTDYDQIEEWIQKGLIYAIERQAERIDGRTLPPPPPPKVMVREKHLFMTYVYEESETGRQLVATELNIEEVAIAGAAVVLIVVAIVLVVMFARGGRRESYGQGAGAAYVPPGPQPVVQNVIGGGYVTPPGPQAGGAQPSQHDVTTTTDITIVHASGDVTEVPEKTLVNVQPLPGKLEILFGGKQTGRTVHLYGLVGDACAYIGRLPSNLSSTDTPPQCRLPNYIGLSSEGVANAAMCSRVQVKISYDVNSKRFTISNCGKGTVDVDNQMLKPGEAAELKDGSTIHLPPEWKFRFVCTR